MLKSLCATLLAVFSAPYLPAPVGFADSWMVMGEAGREFKQFDAMLSPTARYSIAATLTRMEDADRGT